MERDANLEKAQDQFLDGILQGRFTDVFQQEELERFYRFLDKRGRASGGFVISLPLETGGKAWFRYKIDTEASSSTEITINEIAAFVPDKFENRSLPETLDGLPIWWLE